VRKSQPSSVRPPPNLKLCGLAVNGRSNLAAIILWRVNRLNRAGSAGAALRSFELEAFNRQNLVPLNGFGLQFGVRCWNLPLAISLGINALQTTRCRRDGWRFHTGLRRVERAITMQITNFKNMYIAELQELVSMEGQLADELPRMAEVASHPSLKNILMHHRDETQVQRQRLESILQKHGANPRAHIDQAMQALVNETEMMLVMLEGNDLRDAGLIASAQKLEHYEIAAYGTVAALAGQLDLRDDQQVLHQSLEEEKQADVRLTKLAKREVNPDALAA
jgi:ferritin-like metal-binding protein YciE